MTTVKAIFAALAAVVLTAALLVALVGCTPATTRALCDTSAIVEQVAHPSSAPGKLALQVGSFIRSMFCPKTPPA